MDVPSSWDALRKQARNLEAQLDEQMNSYRKLITTKADIADNDLESVIQHLLKQLDQVNNQMRAWVSSGGAEVVSHTLTRHQEILQDLTQEFYRLRSGLRAKQEHASLLEDFREFDRSRLDLEEGGNTVERGLLKEHASISRSTRQLTLDQILGATTGDSRRILLFLRRNPPLVHLCFSVQHLGVSIQSSAMSAVAFQR